MDTIIIIERILGFIFGVLLFYFALRLLNELKNKEIAVSMVFLQKKRITNLFGLVAIAALFGLLSGFYYTLVANNIVVEIFLDLDALGLLIFTYSLQKLMRGDESKWI
jgi:hypothetical protein